MDLVWLYGVECRCRVGAPAEERRRRQRITIDVGLETDAAPAAAQDDLRLAVDYQAVERVVRETAEARERRLVETLASDVAAAVLAREPRARSVRVVVHKRPKVMPRTREVVVSIERVRR